MLPAFDGCEAFFFIIDQMNIDHFGKFRRDSGASAASESHFSSGLFQFQTVKTAQPHPRVGSSGLGSSGLGSVGLGSSGLGSSGPFSSHFAKHFFQPETCFLIKCF